MRLLTTETRSLGRRTVSILVDNQASLQRHRDRKKGTGGRIFNEIHKMARQLKQRHYGVNIKMRWVPSHTGNVAGNDAADREAKKAAADATDNKNCDFGILKHHIPASKAARRHKLKSEIVDEYKQNFREGPRYRKFSRIDPTMPSNKFRRMTRNMTRAQASLLVQLRTGHVALNSYLYRFKLADSPACTACNMEAESVRHLLCFCPKYKAERQQLRRDLGPDIEINDSLLADPKRIRPVLRYLAATGRFTDSHGTLEDDPKPDTNTQESEIEEDPPDELEDITEWI